MIRLNGKPVAELAAESAGQSVLLPTAPGDRITIVSTDEERSVLVDRQIDDRSEVGDLIAYYPFESGSGTTILDESGNDNHGTVDGGYNRLSSCGSAIDFDGTSGTHINVGDLSVDGPDSIDQLTVAIRYQHDQGSGIQNLIEYQNANYAWYIETDDKFGNPHQMEYNIGYQSSPSNRIETGDIPSGPTQVLVGTHDGNQMSLYRNGAQVGTADLDRDVSLGEIILAADSDPSGVGQNLDGRLCEVRLYYTAFDEEEVDVLTEAMS